MFPGKSFLPPEICDWFLPFWTNTVKKCSTCAKPMLNRLQWHVTEQMMVAMKPVETGWILNLRLFFDIFLTTTVRVKKLWNVFIKSLFHAVFLEFMVNYGPERKHATP